MKNAPMPWQLNVGQLRAAIAEVPDDVVVSLVLAPSTQRHECLTLFLNVGVSYQGGPVLKLHPTGTTPLPPPAAARAGALKIAAAGNVVVPAVLALESQGFAVTCNRGESRETWTASRGDLQASGEDPVQVLGLVALLLSRGESWPASDGDIADVTRRFALD